MLLLDQGLPRSTTLGLRDAGLPAEHVGDLGLADAADSVILARAREHSQIVVTLDADFHAQLALSGASVARTTDFVVRVSSVTPTTTATTVLRDGHAAEKPQTDPGGLRYSLIRWRVENQEKCFLGGDWVYAAQ